MNSMKSHFPQCTFVYNCNIWTEFWCEVIRYSLEGVHTVMSHLQILSLMYFPQLSRAICQRLCPLPEKLWPITGWLEGPEGLAPWPNLGQLWRAILVPELTEGSAERSLTTTVQTTSPSAQCAFHPSRRCYLLRLLHNTPFAQDPLPKVCFQRTQSNVLTSLKGFKAGKHEPNMSFFYLMAQQWMN